MEQDKQTQATQKSLADASPVPPSEQKEFPMISQSDFTVRKNHKLRIQWPNLGIDQKAWELAKVASEPDEALSVTIARAQEIKESLADASPVPPSEQKEFPMISQSDFTVRKNHCQGAED